MWSASKWATFRFASCGVLELYLPGPTWGGGIQTTYGGTHPNYIRLADATSMPGKAVRAAVARPSPPFPSPREADPPLPSQTWRKGASNIRQTFAPVCNRQVGKFLNIWRAWCPATVVVVVAVVLLLLLLLFCFVLRGPSLPFLTALQRGGLKQAPSQQPRHPLRWAARQPMRPHPPPLRASEASQTQRNPCNPAPTRLPQRQLEEDRLHLLEWSDANK